jgi:aryl-alcohol dehydrogenase-like predicted oxidoreductase
MLYTKLGNTGLKVSVAGLGCGGNSRVGLGAGLSPREAVALVGAALDLGVNILDTAEAYDTEEIVGAAIAGRRREDIVISTKTRIGTQAGMLSGTEAVGRLDASLRRLNSDYIDVYNLHGVSPAAYDGAVERIVPALLREKEKGKFRHLGITETGPRDPEHKMLERALEDPRWEVVMLAFHMLNQNARANVLKQTRAKGVGTQCMFAVRNIFSKPGLLKQTVAELAAEGKLPAHRAASAEPLAFLVHPGGARNIIDAAYRFARHEPGIDVVLFGTSSLEHLRANVASILSPPLPAGDVEKLYELFGHLVGVGLDLPDRVRARRPA